LERRGTELAYCGGQLGGGNGRDGKMITGKKGGDESLG